jgi:uncharacterized protein (DUF1697 family)
MPYEYVALLRGINVGGRNKLPMKDLAVMFQKAGCTEVQTFIQSGNVLFNAPAKIARQIPVLVPVEIERKFGHRPPFVMRTAQQFAAVLENNPFPGVDEDHLYVMFLASAPEAARVKTLDPARSAPDTFLVRGTEIYLNLPNGAGETKLTNAYFDSKLATTSTFRNWRTLTKLTQLLF